jgi:RNase P subunit RPR2
MNRTECKGCLRVGSNADVVVEVARHDLRTRYVVRLCHHCYWAFSEYLEALSVGTQASLPETVVTSRKRRAAS